MEVAECAFEPAVPRGSDASSCIDVREAVKSWALENTRCSGRPAL